MSRYGYPETDWERAKSEMRSVLVEVARTPEGFISYSELVARVTAISFDPRDPRLWYMLREISSEENAAGHGMLTAIVTHARGDMMPGEGFFDLARALGYDPRDQLGFWLQQVEVVRGHWTRST
jgi:hypothetical protein